MATKKPFELEREIAALKAEHHEKSPNETPVESEIRHALIKKLSDELNELYTAGAKAPKGVKLMGIKKDRGLYEIGDMQGLRSQGETVEEAAQNWNDGVFVPFTGVGFTVS
jgi:hypothetical protein